MMARTFQLVCMCCILVASATTEFGANLTCQSEQDGTALLQHGTIKISGNEVEDVEAVATSDEDTMQNVDEEEEEQAEDADDEEKDEEVHGTVPASNKCVEQKCNKFCKFTQAAWNKMRKKKNRKRKTTHASHASQR